MNSKKGGPEHPKRPPFPEEEPTTNLGRIKLRKVQVSPDDLSRLMDPSRANQSAAIGMLDQGMPKDPAEMARQGGTLLHIVHQYGLNGFLDELIRLVQAEDGSMDFDKAVGRYMGKMEQVEADTGRMKRLVKRSRGLSEGILRNMQRSVAMEVLEELSDKEQLGIIMALWANGAAAKYIRRDEAELRSKLFPTGVTAPEMTMENLSMGEAISGNTARNLARIAKMSQLDQVPTAESEREKLQRHLAVFALTKGDMNKALTSPTLGIAIKDKGVDRHVAMEVMATRARNEAARALTHLDLMAGVSEMTHQAQAYRAIQRALIIFRDLDLVDGIIQNEALGEVEKHEAIRRMTERQDLKSLKGKFEGKIRALSIIYPRLGAIFDFNQLTVITHISMLSRGIFQKQYDKSPDNVRKMIRSAAIVANQPVVDYPDKED